jgi:hypothetical protein
MEEQLDRLPAAALASRAEGMLLRRRGDGVFISLAFAQAAALVLLPFAPVFAIGLWWGSNTVSHNFIHRPFFRSRGLNRLFSVYLSVLLGVPQSLWKARHAAHHAGTPPRWRWTPLLGLEVAAVLALWSLLAALEPATFWLAYAPGWLAGLLLAAVHGHFEHHVDTVSHYGRLYNLLFFNDGYHIEHHAAPTAHWSELPRRAAPGARTSAWPPVLRWLEGSLLDGLELAAVHSRWLRLRLLASHRRATAALLDAGAAGPIRSALVIGGGLFPRTALVLRDLLPAARLTVIDGKPRHLERAREMLETAGLGFGVEWIADWYDPRRHVGFDLVVVPLAYRGDRRLFYERPPARRVLVHDWIWRRHPPGRPPRHGPSPPRSGHAVSWWLLKRLNLVRGDGA